MSAFVTERRIAITERGETNPADLTPDTNAIFIRPKMNLGAKSRAIDALTRIKAGEEMELNVGTYQLVLLKVNVVAWQGPDFHGVACTEGTIANLDPDHPLIAPVLAAIAERNPVGDADPKSSTASTTTAGAPNSPDD